MAMLDLEPLLTPQEVAVVLHVPASWVYARTRTGELPVRKIGRLCRIPRGELAAWIERQAVSQRNNDAA
jgi:excisionase family DNA binding protein